MTGQPNSNAAPEDIPPAAAEPGAPTLQDPHAAAKGCGCMTVIALAVIGMIVTALVPSESAKCENDLRDLLNRTGNNRISWSDTRKISDMCEDGNWTNDF